MAIERAGFRTRLANALRLGSPRWTGRGLRPKCEPPSRTIAERQIDDGFPAAVGQEPFQQHARVRWFNRFIDIKQLTIGRIGDGILPVAARDIPPDRAIHDGRAELQRAVITLFSVAQRHPSGGRTDCGHHADPTDGAQTRYGQADRP